MVLEGTLTLILGEPGQPETLPASAVAAVRPGTPIHVRNDSDSEVLFLAYGAPPVADAADELPEPTII